LDLQRGRPWWPPDLYIPASRPNLSLWVDFNFFAHDLNGKRNVRRRVREAVRISLSPRRTIGALSYAVVLALVARPGAARADVAEERSLAASSCVVSVVPADSSATWRAVAAELARRLDAIAVASKDCASVSVHVTGDRTAVVVFATRDGRHAVRHIASPTDLVPVVEALAITIPPAFDRSPPVVDQPAPSVDVSPPREQPLAAAPSATPPPAIPLREDARVLLGARGGGRLASPGAFVAPTFGVSGAIAAGRWDLGIFGQWDPTNIVLGGAPNGFQMSSLGVGVSIGRREPLGRVAALVVGGSLAASITSASGATANAGTNASGEGQGTGDGAGGSTRAEPRAGAYAGIVFPPRSRVRLRAELAADVVASRIGRSLTIDPALPALPWWSLMASIGAEWEVR
jgi:hypothetical protein